MTTSLAASAVGDAEEGSVAAANGSTATAAVATGSSTGSTPAVSDASADATTGSVDACTSVSSDRPGGCLEFELEALKKPKELREPYSSCPAILLFA
jgi:hypothetical protein